MHSYYRVDVRRSRYYYGGTFSRMDIAMPAVTLKLPQDLKTRINNLAAASGKSPHAFMVDALAAQAAREELRGAFVASALAARREVARCGQAMGGAGVPQGLAHR